MYSESNNGNDRPCLHVTNSHVAVGDGPRPFLLQIPSLVIRAGQTVFLHGASGSGKTTLLKLLSAVIPSALARQVRAAFPTIGYVMHESCLLPWLDVRRNLVAEAALRGVSPPFDEFSANISALGLPVTCLERPAVQLSLGMRQRVELAKALAFRVHLLLLDEALSGLDLDSKYRARVMLRRHVLSFGVSVVATAHQITDILALADCVYSVNSGVVSEQVQIDPPVEDRLQMTPSELLRCPYAEVLLRQ